MKHCFETLYSWVKELPIVDWHNHLDLAVLAEDNPLGSLYEVWVKADPYKHRAMRICGEPERVITGDASEDEKWAAWTRTLPKLVGNPLFAWAQQELAFLRGTGNGERGTGEPNSSAAAKWWKSVENVSLAEWTPSKILKKFNVEYLSPCVGAGELEGLLTSDARLQKAPEAGFDPKSEVLSPKSSFKVVPSLRMNAGDDISEETLERFDAVGCRVVDVSVDDVDTLRTLRPLWLKTVPSFAATRGWTMLLHLGALRETSARLRAAAGPAGGFAGMRAPVDPAAVAAFLNGLESTHNVFSRNHLRRGYGGQEERKGNVKLCNCGNMELCKYENGMAGRGNREEGTGNSTIPQSHNSTIPQFHNNSLPRTILMSLNPEAHASLAVLAGSFNEEGVPGKVQLGPAWWWCDHEEGIRDVLEKNAAYGVLSTFVGMTTDSRSLLSFVRHDYFRRVLCKWVAEKVASGSFPDDEALLRPLLENVCYKNAHDMVCSHKEHKGNVKLCNCGNMELCKYENENSHNPIIPKFHNSIIAQSNNPVNPVNPVKNKHRKNELILQ